MSDSCRLHASFMNSLQSELAEEDERHLDTLAWALTGALLQKTVHLPAWISSWPEAVDAASRERCLRRWLSASDVAVGRFYQPFITQALASWPGHTLFVAVDTTSVADQLVIARTAVIYRGRAVPLAWQVFQRQSVMLRFEQYEGLIRATASLIPPGVTVILLGDRGFRDVRLMALPRQWNWHVRLRLTGNECVWSEQQPRARLDSWVLSPYQPCFLPEVYLTDQRYGPVHVALAWDGDPQHDPWRIASDQPASLQTLADYALRMGIDLGFLDDKSAGFQLQDTELLKAHRLNRLLLVLALGTLYLVSLGTHLVALGQRRRVDPHWHRGLSYLQLGWRWLDYCLAGDAPLPVLFHLDPAPDPEPLSQTGQVAWAPLREPMHENKCVSQ